MKGTISVKDFDLNVLKDTMDKHINHNSIFKHKTIYSVAVARKNETFTTDTYHFGSLESAIDKYNEIVIERNPYYIDLRWYDMFLNDIPLPNGGENWITNVYDIIHIAKGDKIVKTPYNLKLSNK